MLRGGGIEGGSHLQQAQVSGTGKSRGVQFGCNSCQSPQILQLSHPSKGPCSYDSTRWSFMGIRLQWNSPWPRASSQPWMRKSSYLGHCEPPTINTAEPLRPLESCLPLQEGSVRLTPTPTTQRVQTLKSTKQNWSFIHPSLLADSQSRHAKP